jgi:hypothetical protein
MTSAADAPVSSIARNTNDVPPRFTTSLTSTVAMISRRSRCPAIRAAYRSRSGVGKYFTSTSVVQASSTSSSASTSRSRPILTYASSTANSGAVRPSPASYRVASSRSVGSASSSRLS